MATEGSTRTSIVNGQPQSQIYKNGAWVEDKNYESPQPKLTPNGEVIETVALTVQGARVNAETGVALRYPFDFPITSDSDYVVFDFYKYAPPFGGARGVTNSVESSTTEGSFSAGYTNYQSSNDRSYANPAAELQSIILYMPEDIQTQFGAGWNGAGFGAATAGMLGATGSLTTQKDVLKVLQAGGESVTGIAKTATFSALIAGINAATGANINLNQALGTITGTIINPNVELAYEAPKLRNFSLKFKLVSRSGNESKIIRNICNTFKKSMLPSFGGSALFGTTEASNLLTIPRLCQVSFMKGSTLHPYLPRYKLCGITDVNINYTADGSYATYGDGAPVSTEITLSFLESKLIFSDEIKEDGSGI